MSIFRLTVFPLFSRNFSLSLKRTFLSNAYDCKDVWDNRLNQTIFKKINIETMYYDLDYQFTKKNILMPIDVDIFVNVQTTDQYLTEVEETVHRLRMTRNTHLTLPTTQHAFIRLFYKYKDQDLVRILNDKLNYGIFPDDYLLIYLMDKFLKKNDIRSAAKIGALPMYQEDYSHPLTKYMSLYAIHKYILANIPWDDKIEDEKEIKNEEEEEEEEEIKIKVPYLRNPYFDDHFDLTDGQHICGKSLVMISSNLDNNALKNSYKIMGLALWNKWEELEKELNNILQSQKNSTEPLLYNDAVNLSSNIVNKKLQEKSNKITSLVGEIHEDKHNFNNLFDDLESIVKEVVKVHEPDIIKFQNETYKNWETLRNNELERHMQELERNKRLEAVEIKKKELENKDQLMHFFENEDEIELICEEKQNKLDKKSKYLSEKEEEDNYVPPEVQKRLSEDDL